MSTYDSVFDPKDRQFVVFGEMGATCSGKCQKRHLTSFSSLLSQLTDFVERLLKHARNGDLQLMRRPLESKFGMLLTYSDSPAALDGLADFEFVSDFAAIQNSIRSTFGYVRARHDSGQVSCYQD